MVNLYLLGRDLLATASPWDSHAIALLYSSGPFLCVRGIIVEFENLSFCEVNKAI